MGDTLLLTTEPPFFVGGKANVNYTVYRTRVLARVLALQRDVAHKYYRA